MTTTIQTGTGQRTFSESSTVSSPKRLARIAGLLYLVVGILGGFAFAGVYSKMYVGAMRRPLPATLSPTPDWSGSALPPT